MPSGKKRKRQKNLPVDAYSRQEFCDAHNIGLTTYYILLDKGEAPREFKIRSRFYISKEAAADWRRLREQQHAAA